MNSHPQNPISRLPKQEALPFEAAQRYEDTVLAWARDQSLPPGIAVTRDCAYGPDPHQRYDVYRSSDAQDAPILIFWHGGGWTNGYKEYVAFMAQAVVDLGMVLVAPDYRLAPAHRLPAALEDSMAVTGHVIANAAHFGGRSDHIYLAGHSAGAHLAALVALRRDDAIGAGIPSSAIRACLPVSGIMDLHHPEPAAGSLEERVYSMVLRDAADDAVMSPLCWRKRSRQVLEAPDAVAPRQPTFIPMMLPAAVVRMRQAVIQPLWEVSVSLQSVTSSLSFCQCHLKCAPCPFDIGGECLLTCADRW